VIDLWRAYFLTYERQGKNPRVGRHLISLLHEAGAVPRGARCLPFGSCAGSPNFEAMIENFIGIIDGARTEIVSFGLADEKEIDEGLKTFREWRHRPDSAMWYTTCWAEGIRPLPSGVGVSAVNTPDPPVIAEREIRREGSESAGDLVEDEASLLRFLMGAANELSSSLELDEVFHEIAREIRPLIDYHLFCIMLWNERTQVLEHSFSMKYGKVIPQRGGFPLGYGLSGTAAKLRRSVRVANVQEDPRYVRYRHPEVEIHSELAVPLIHKGELIGALDLESTEFDLAHRDGDRKRATVRAAPPGRATARGRAGQRARDPTRATAPSRAPGRRSGDRVGLPAGRTARRRLLRFPALPGRPAGLRGGRRGR
jgi:hypothetical protein